MTTTKTKNGTEVLVEALANGDVRLTFSHPQYGECRVVSRRWGVSKGGEGAIGSCLSEKGGVRKTLGDVCVTIPREDFDHALAEAGRLKDDEVARELAAFRSGERKITLTYHDGEILSGYGVSGPAAKLLIELGLASPVEGWGYHVRGEVAKALGEEFTYAQAQEYAAPALAAAEAQKKAKADERAAKLATTQAEARRTGRPVVINRAYSHDTGEGSVFVTTTIDGDGKIESSEFEEVISPAPKP